MLSRGPRGHLFRLAAAAAVAALALLAGASPGGARGPDLPPAPRPTDSDGDRLFDDLEYVLAAAQPDEPIDVLVTLDRPLSPQRLGRLRERLGPFPVRFQYPSISGFAATLTRAQVLALARAGAVRQIERDRLLRPTLDTASYWFGVTKARGDFGLDGNADGDPGYSTGDIVIAVLDSGVNPSHVDLDGGKIIAWADFINGQPDPYDEGADCGYHGTHVASIALGEGDGNPLYPGVAPGAALVAVKVLGMQSVPGKGLACVGSTSQVNAGIQWVIDNKDTYNIRVMNLSLGDDTCSDGQDSQSQLVNQAVAAGIVVVVSAGNEGPAACTISTPAAAEEAITVAAMSDVDPGAAIQFSCDSSGNFVAGGFRLACFSGRGPTLDGRIKPDIAAPGVFIAAADGASNTGYINMSGTSMASPFVAGVVALMLQADPSLTPAQVKSILTSTAQDWGPPGPDSDYGAGRLDAYEAIRVAAGAAGSGINLPNHELPNHEMVEGTLAPAGQPGDSVSYTISVSDPSLPLAATLLMTNWSPSQDFQMELRDAGGAQVALSESTTRQETIGILSPNNGPYTLTIYALADGGFSSDGGPFVFDLSVGGSLGSDMDGDGIADDADNCLAWPNPDQSLPPWPVAEDDPDCDGWSSADESFIGTDPLLMCGAGAWPPDLDDSRNIDILDIAQMTPPVFGSSSGDPDYSVRKDLQPDGIINILDIVLITPPVFGSNCTAT